ncbi:hypothetical protein JNB11_04925 [Kocuria palustris]|nr:hypothetical protein [Kocuria palustris]
MDQRPREERDYKEIYPDLDETDVLPVFVDDGDVEWPPQQPRVATKTPKFRALDLAKPDEVPAPLWQRFGYITDKEEDDSVPTAYHRPYEHDPLPPRVAYDCDAQDVLFVEWCRQKNIHMSAELLEVAMTLLDRQWDQLDQALDHHHHHHRYLTLDHDLDKYGSDDGIVPGSEYDQRCAVCNDSDCTDDNAIVFCDGCDIAVHQECYGIAFIPEGLWLCRHCMINRDKPANCVCCPLSTGAFKQLDSSKWAHVVCALWINELYFANPTYMEPIEGLSQVPKSRWRLVCYLCKKRVGACIQCYNRQCVAAYHVTCAKRAGLYMELSEGIQGALRNKTLLKLYCNRHSPPGWLADVSKCRNYYRDLDILVKQNAQLTRRYQAATRLNQFKWKTIHNTPIAPHKFAHALGRELGYRRCPLKSAFALCKWWCLKRDARRGRLIRGPGIDGGAGRADGVSAATTEALVANLDHLIGLSLTSVKAQQIRSELGELEWTQVARAYGPRHQLISSGARGSLSRAPARDEFPFVEVDGVDVKLKPYDYRQVLADAELLEVEGGDD